MLALFAGLVLGFADGAVVVLRSCGAFCDFGLFARIVSQPATPPRTISALPLPSRASTSLTVRSRNTRSWLTTTTMPGQSSRYSSSARSVSKSRSFVGSSSSSTFGCSINVSNNCRRRRSPPDNVEIGANCESPSNQKRRIRLLSSTDGVTLSPATASRTVCVTTRSRPSWS